MIPFRGGQQLPSGQRTGLGSGFGGVISYLMEGPKLDRDAVALGAAADRVAWTSTRNLPVHDPEHAAVFMRAWANQNGRVLKPVYHFGVSLAPGEHLDKEQWQVVTDRMLESLGLSQHQVFIALHQDRDHEHVHFAVNRVGPDGRAWKPHFDALTKQSEARKLERDFGLRMVPTQRDVEVEQKKLAMEARLELFAGRVSSAALKDFHSSSDWQDLETRLAAKGLRLTPARRGGGINITDGSLTVAISRLGRDISGPRLAKRYGQTLREHRRDQPPPIPTTTFDRPDSTPELSIERRANDLRSQLEQSHATWTWVHVDRLCAGHKDSTALAALVMESNQVVVIGTDPNELTRYSTVAYLRAEDSLLKSAQELHTRRELSLPHEHVRRILSERHLTLSTEQSAAVVHATTGTDCAIVVGRAGSGKTRLTTAIVDAYSDAGYQVQGAALAGIAAEGLAEETGISTKTLAAYEMSWERGKGQLSPQDVLVIDEAGMIDTYQLERVLAHARAHGAKIVLVGDPDQLPPVGAGDPLRGLVQHLGCARVDTVWRQRIEWQRQASELFITEGPARALEAYAAHDCLHWTQNPEQTLEALLMTYFEDRYRAPNESSIVLAPQNVQVLELNNRIRNVRKRHGELANEIRLNGTDFASGDRILFLKNDNHGTYVKTVSGEGIGVKNGATGTLLVNDPDRFSVHLDSGRVVEFNPQNFNSLTHGYAATVHKAQGTTVDRAYVLLDPGFNRNTSYVAFTRHREALHLYADQETFSTRGELHATLERKPAVDLAMDYQPPSVSNLPQQRGGPPRSLPGLQKRYLELTDARLEEVVTTIEELQQWDHLSADIAAAVAQRSRLPHEGSLPDLERDLSVQQFGAARNRLADEQAFEAIYRDPEAALARFTQERTSDPRGAYQQLHDQPDRFGKLKGQPIGQTRKTANSRALQTAQLGHTRLLDIQQHTENLEAARDIAKELEDLSSAQKALGENRLAVLDRLRSQVETLDQHALELQVPEHLRPMISTLKRAETTHLNPLAERSISVQPSGTDSLKRHRATSLPLPKALPFTPRGHAGPADRPAVTPELPLALRAKHVIAHLEDHHATWTQRNLEYLCQIDPEPEALLDTVLMHPDVHSVGLDPTGQEHYSSQSYLESEQRLWHVAHELGERSELRLTAHEIESTLEAHKTLPDDHRAAFLHATTGSDLAVVVGAEGEEKDALIRAIAQAHVESGYTVRGAAVGGQAADALAQNIGADARSLTAYELSWQQGRGELTPRDVMIVDEAAMVDTHQMRRLVEHATSRGAKVVLLDQHAQLKPLGAGDALRGLIQRQGAAHVQPIHQQSTAWQRQASADLAAGRIEGALQSYADHGCVEWTVDRAQAREALVMQYFEDRNNRPALTSLVFARRNADVLAINDRIRELRVVGGELRDGVVVRGREYAPGDRLMFLRNDNSGRTVRTVEGEGRGVKNGALGTILETSETNIRVRLDTARIVEFDPTLYSSLAHGYAGNLYKSRHTAVDQAYVLTDPGFDSASTYVATTRHRESLHIYADEQSFRTGKDLLATLSRQPQKTLAADYNPPATVAQPANDTLSFVQKPTLPLSPESLAQSQAALQNLHRWDRHSAELQRLYIARERLPHAGTTALLERDINELGLAEPGSVKLKCARDALATARHYEVLYASTLHDRSLLSTNREDLVERAVSATRGLDPADLELSLPSDLHPTLADLQRAKRIHLDPLRLKAISSNPSASEALADFKAGAGTAQPEVQESGESFAQRVADAALVDFRDATNWGELEDRLAAKGLRLNLAQRGGGINVTDTEQTVAISRLDRNLSGPKLARRFGNEPFRKYRRSNPEPPALRIRFDRPTVTPNLPLEVRAQNLIDHLEQHHATWTRQDVVRLAKTDSTPEELVGHLFLHPNVVSVGKDIHQQEHYSTHGYLQTETRLWAAARDLTERSNFQLSPSTVIDGLAPNSHAAYQHATAGQDLAIVLGGAGDDKARLLQAVVRAHREAGYTVRGAALGGQAADSLARHAGIESRTLAAHELAWQRGKNELTSLQALIIDDAGMVDAHQMQRVLDHAAHSGAKVILLDTHDHLKPIGAGDPLRGLTQRHGAARLSPSSHHAHDWQMEAAAALTEGRIEAALRQYSEHGSVHWSRDSEQAQEALVARYFEDDRRSPDQTALVIARRNVDVLRLNERIRSLRQLEPGVSVRGYEYAAGDRMFFTRNDATGRLVKTLEGEGRGVSNGSLATVLEVSEDCFRVRLDTGRTVEFDPTEYTSLSYGYAATIHKARAITADRTYVLADAGFDRTSTVVAMSRHRESLKLYADEGAFETGQRLADTLTRESRKTLASDYAPPTLDSSATPQTAAHPPLKHQHVDELTPERLSQVATGIDALQRWDRAREEVQRLEKHRQTLPYGASVLAIEDAIATDAAHQRPASAELQQALATAQQHAHTEALAKSALRELSPERGPLLEDLRESVNALEPSQLHNALEPHQRQTLADLRTAERIHPSPEESFGRPHTLQQSPTPAPAPEDPTFGKRVAETASEDFTQAATWTDLEDRLAAKGLQLNLCANGINVTDTERSLAISSVDRRFSGPRLAHQYGESFRQHRRLNPEPPPLKLHFDRPNVTPALPLPTRVDNMLAHLEDHHATWTRQDVERLAKTDSTPQELTASLLAHPSVVSVGEDVQQRAHYSTHGYLQSESRLWSAAQNLKERSELQVSDSGRMDTLPTDSRAAYLDATAGQDLAIVLAADSNEKADLLQAIVGAHREAGYEVRGAALAGQGAESLTRTAGIESKTLAAHEIAWQQGRDNLTSKQVLLIEHAGMVDTHQMRRVLEHAADRGAKVLLLDTDTHLTPIGAGDPLRGLTERHGAAHLHPEPRQTQAWQREAAAQLADGKIEAALKQYSEHGSVQWAADTEQTHDALLTRYIEDHHEFPDQTAFVITRRNADALQLNDRIRRLRAGELGQAVSVRGKDYAEGDRLFFLRNDTRGRVVKTIEGEGRGVSNGALGTVLTASAERFRVRLDTGRTVEFDPTQYDSLSYGYAGTLHKARSLEVDRAYVLADTGFDRTSTTVAMTRHRVSLTLFADQNSFETGQRFADTLTREPRKALAADLDPPSVAISTTPVAGDTWLPPRDCKLEALTPERLAQVTHRIEALQRWDRVHQDVQRLVDQRKDLPYRGSVADISEALRTQPDSERGQLQQALATAQRHHQSEALAMTTLHQIAPDRETLLESLRDHVRSIEPNQLHNALPQHQRQTLTDLRTADRIHVRPLLEALDQFNRLRQTPSRLQDVRKLYKTARRIAALRKATPKSLLKTLLFRLAPPQMQAFIAASAIAAAVARRVGKIANFQRQHERGALNI